MGEGEKWHALNKVNSFWSIEVEFDRLNSVWIMQNKPLKNIKVKGIFTHQTKGDFMLECDILC